jgi:hypothetical protein
MSSAEHVQVEILANAPAIMLTRDTASTLIGAVGKAIGYLVAAATR